MKSMTGYGKCVVEENSRTLTVEMKSVNNRYLEINCRMPKTLAAFEETAKRTVKKYLNRGSVDVYFTYENNAEKHLAIDEATAKAYYEASKKISELLGVENNYASAELIKTNGVIVEKADEEDEAMLKALVERAVEGAVRALDEMRTVEGATATKDLLRLVDNIDGALAKAENRAPKVVAEYREKLKSRITELLGEVAIDETRLLNEVAFFADKADINEEISRLHSHIAQFRASCANGGPQGRNLDFVSQEMGREINTMGSKSNDSELTALVIYMKNELEKIKEQIRNVE